jgi:hypothetical protein
MAFSTMRVIGDRWDEGTVVRKGHPSSRTLSASVVSFRRWAGRPSLPSLSRFRIAVPSPPEEVCYAPEFRRRRALLSRSCPSGVGGILSEAHVKRGRRVVHGDKELSERLGRNDLCPCDSGLLFKNCCRNSGRFRRRGAGPLRALRLSGVIAEASSGIGSCSVSFSFRSGVGLIPSSRDRTGYDAGSF